MVMGDEWLFALTLLGALGCGLIAGVFFAFSTFVMRALARLPSGEGIAAMQSINITVLNPWFLGAFFATAVVCTLVLISTVVGWQKPGAVYLVAGSVLYLVGTFLVTIVFNVPRNKSLASVVPTDSDATNRWAGYLTSWTIWNHVRTVAAFTAAAAFSVALSH